MVLLREFARTERLATLAIALMLTVPFLLPFNQLPIRSFYQEWIAAFLGVVAFVLMTASKSENRLEIPYLVLLPVLLVLIVGTQALAGRLVFVQQGMLGALYLIWASIMLVAGFRLRACLGSESFAAVLAWPLLLGASASAIIGLLQHFDWTLAGWVLPSGRARGNLLQANHFSNYLFLGLASAIFLASTRRIGVFAAGTAMLLMLVAVSLGGSRSVVIYLALLICGALALKWRRSSPEFDRVALWAVTCVAIFVLLEVISLLPGAAARGGAGSIASQVIAEGGATDSRLRMWHSALLMAAESPWIGVGFKGFAWHHFLLAPDLAVPTERLAANHAHNVLLQVLAELGIAAALLCIAAAIAWLVAQRRKTPSPGVAWMWAAFGILLVHSGLEYPLWYAYFLGLFCLLLGAGWHPTWSISLTRSAVTVVAVACGAAVALTVLWMDYRALTELLRTPYEDTAESQPTLSSRVMEIYKHSLFPHELVFALARGATVDSKHLQSKIELNAAALHVLPTPSLAYRQAMFLSLADKEKEANQAWDRAVAAYPWRAERMIRALEADEPERFRVLIEYARRKTGKTL